MLSEGNDARRMAYVTCSEPLSASRAQEAIPAIVPITLFILASTSTVSLLSDSASICQLRHSVLFHRSETGAFIGHRRSIGLVLPWKVGGLPRTDRLTQRPRQRRSVTVAAECSSARASSAVLVLSPPLSCPGASVSAKAPVRSTCRRCHHGQTIRQPTSRSTVHSALPCHARTLRVVTPLPAVFFAIPLPRPQRCAHALLGSIASSSSSVVSMPRTPASA